MPRLPVDGKKVVEYRVTLGAKERQLFQDAQWSYTFGKIGNTLSGIIANPVFLLGLAGYIAYKLDEWLDPNWREIVDGMTEGQVSDWLETQNLAGATIGGIIGLYFGPLGAIVGSILGSVAVEWGEYFYGEIDERVDETMEGVEEILPSNRQVVGIFLLMMKLERALKNAGEALQPNGSSSSGGGGGGGGGGSFAGPSGVDYGSDYTS